MKDNNFDMLSETHTAIEADTLSAEQLYRRLSESFDPIAVARRGSDGR